MIAACDTFRSGAVEQLKTHCARLDVPLYERGGVGCWFEEDCCRENALVLDAMVNAVPSIRKRIAPTVAA